MKKNIIRVIIAIVWLVTIILSFYIGMVYHWATTTELEMSKDYNEITVCTETKFKAKFKIFEIFETAKNYIEENFT